MGVERRRSGERRERSMAGRIGCAAEDGAMHTADGWSDDSGAEGWTVMPKRRDVISNRTGRFWMIGCMRSGDNIFRSHRDNPIPRNSYNEYLKYTYIETSYTFYQAT